MLPNIVAFVTDPARFKKSRDKGIIPRCRREQGGWALPWGQEAVSGWPPHGPSPCERVQAARLCSSRQPRCLLYPPFRPKPSTLIPIALPPIAPGSELIPPGN